MTTLLIVVGCLAVIFITVVFGKHSVARDDRKRKHELANQAGTLYTGLRLIDAYDRLYVHTVTQLYRFRYKGENYEHLERDARLIIEMRKSEIENQVLRELDTPSYNIVSLGKRIPRHAEQHARG